jgi:hypothetical protein
MIELADRLDRPLQLMVIAQPPANLFDPLATHAQLPGATAGKICSVLQFLSAQRDSPEPSGPLNFAPGSSQQTSFMVGVRGRSAFTRSVIGCAAQVARAAPDGLLISRVQADGVTEGARHRL